MTAKNAEGYPDPTAEEAIRHVMRGGKLDYTSFRTYEELQDYTIEHNNCLLYTSPSPRDA